MKILDHKIKIVECDGKGWNTGSLGEFNSEELTIRIKKGLEPQVYATTLLHELVHVKQYLFGLNMDEDEANRDALFWYSVLKNNEVIK